MAASLWKKFYYKINIPQDSVIPILVISLKGAKTYANKNPHNIFIIAKIFQIVLHSKYLFIDLYL